MLVFGRALGASDLQQAIDTNVVVTIAAAFGLAAGVNNSGLATRLSTALVQSLGRFGPRGVLLGVALAAALLKELVTNNAAAALVLPIALTAARTLSLQPRGIAAAVTLACATSFLTPTGYATNIMVYGPGGYTFADYLRLGLPLTALVIAGLVWLVPLGWPI